ncbi:unnamed protein product [Sphagnum balticum]
MKTVLLLISAVVLASTTPVLIIKSDSTSTIVGTNTPASYPAYHNANQPNYLATGSEWIWSSLGDNSRDGTTGMIGRLNTMLPLPNSIAETTTLLCKALEVAILWEWGSTLLSSRIRADVLPAVITAFGARQLAPASVSIQDVRAQLDRNGSVIPIAAVFVPSIFVFSPPMAGQASILRHAVVSAHPNGVPTNNTGAEPTVYVSPFLRDSSNLFG